MYLLDTNIVSDLISNPQGLVASRIAAAGLDAVATSIIVAAELRYGVERKGSARLAGRVETALRLLSVLPLGDDADRYYATLRTRLERAGRPISGNDMFIAAHALALDATLVTGNVRELERVDGLSIKNWLCPD